MATLKDFKQSSDMVGFLRWPGQNGARRTGQKVGRPGASSVGGPGKDGREGSGCGEPRGSLEGLGRLLA